MHSYNIQDQNKYFMLGNFDLIINNMFQILIIISPNKLKKKFRKFE